MSYEYKQQLARWTRVAEQGGDGQTHCTAHSAKQVVKTWGDVTSSQKRAGYGAALRTGLAGLSSSETSSHSGVWDQQDI